NTPWIVNSRGPDDELVVSRLCGAAGYAPMIRHYVDNLALVQELVVAGIGVGLMAETEPRLPGLTLLPINEPQVAQRAYVCTRVGRDSWPPVRLVLDLLKSAVGVG
ncbi:MAG: LysR substrate-binding domain-containing protein, partial [Actinomycetia bacterium]|nr:LysR substrate-binding domain-containing protein [Actinomycetes bacterium]